MQNYLFYTQYGVDIKKIKSKTKTAPIWLDYIEALIYLVILQKDDTKTFIKKQYGK